MGTTMLAIMYLTSKEWTRFLTFIMASVFIFGLIRLQHSVSDDSFVKSMIEHHDSAIFMSESINQKSKDPFILKLTSNIISSQNNEIREMEEWLATKK